MKQEVKCAVVVQAEIYRLHRDLQPHSICAWSEQYYRNAGGDFS